MNYESICNSIKSLPEKRRSILLHIIEIIIRSWEEWDKQYK